MTIFAHVCMCAYRFNFISFHHLSAQNPQRICGAWRVQSKSTQITIICDDVKIEILYKMYKSNRSRQSVMDLSIQFFFPLLFSSVRVAMWRGVLS